MVVFPLTRQEQTSEGLKVFLEKFGTLRIVDSGESTPDALFGKLNAVVVAMVQKVSDIRTHAKLHSTVVLGYILSDHT